MSKFKLGQEVVALVTYLPTNIIKGNIYIVDGFTCCPGCGLPCINLKGRQKLYNSICQKESKGCGYREIAVRERYSENAFTDLISKEECAEYKSKISQPELEALKIKEVQLQ